MIATTATQQNIYYSNHPVDFLRVVVDGKPVPSGSNFLIIPFVPWV